MALELFAVSLSIKLFDLEVNLLGWPLLGICGTNMLQKRKWPKRLPLQKCSHLLMTNEVHLVTTYRLKSCETSKC